MESKRSVHGPTGPSKPGSTVRPLQRRVQGRVWEIENPPLLPSHWWIWTRHAARVARRGRGRSRRCAGHDARAHRPEETREPARNDVNKPNEVMSPFDKYCLK